MQTLLDLMPDALLVVATDGRIEQASPAAAARFGVALAALIGTSLPARLVLDEAGWPALCRQALRSPQFSPTRLWLAPAQPGQPPRPCRCDVARLGAADAGPVRLLIRMSAADPRANRFLALNERLELLSREVARRRAAEASLRQQTEWLRVVLRSIGDAVLATDGDARVVFMNPVAERLCGWRDDEARGLAVAEVLQLVDARTGQPADDPVIRALRERRIVGLAPDTALRARDGTLHPIDDAAGPILDDRGRLLGVVLVFREIGEKLRAEARRRALEDQLRGAQRMEAVGTLAGGIAHDFNNVIGAILGSTALALDEVDPEHPVLQRLVHIGRAGRRARDLVRHLMAFSRRQPQHLRVQRLQPLLEETVALLRGLLPSTVLLQADWPEAPLPVRVDANQIEQVLLNLGTNAWHALPDGRGRLRLQVEVTQGASPPGLAPGFAPWSGGRHIAISVEDDGVGMDDATVARIFEPFFTTKPRGRGTGLGLSVVHGIVADHGGALAVRSRPGLGSTFTLFLPWVDEALAEEDAPEPPALEIGLRGRRVVVLDDDEIMRITAEALLQRAGFEVTVCADVPSALRVLGDPLALVDVLVSDVNMPDGSGVDVARQARAMRPALPVILASGYLSDDLRRAAAEVGVVALLAKEESVERLVPLVHQVLAAG